VVKKLKIFIKNYKILNLILYSNTSSEYIDMYKILSKYLKETKIHYYFYAYDPNIDEEYFIIVVKIFWKKF